MPQRYPLFEINQLAQLAAHDGLSTVYVTLRALDLLERCERRLTELTGVEPE